MWDRDVRGQRRGARGNGSGGGAPGSPAERARADRFAADLFGEAPAPVEQWTPMPTPIALPSGGPDLGRVFDRVVYGGAQVIALPPDGPEADEAWAEVVWEPVALPGSAAPLQAFSPGQLVVQRALGEARLATVRVLGEDVEPHMLYGPRGLIREDTLVLGQRPQPTPAPAPTGWTFPFRLQELDSHFDEAWRKRARAAGVAALDGDRDTSYRSFLGLVYRAQFGGHFPLYSRKKADRQAWHGAVDIPIPAAAVGKLAVRSIGDGTVVGASLDTAYSGPGNGGVIVVVRHELPDGRSFLVRYVHLHNLLCTDLGSEDRTRVPSASEFLRWTEAEKVDWTTWLRGRRRILPLRAGTRVRAGEALGPLGFLHSGHHLHLEIISRDVFEGLEPLASREALQAMDPAQANRHRSARGNVGRAYWADPGDRDGWIWYHPLHFLQLLAGGTLEDTAPAAAARAPRPPAPATRPTAPTAPAATGAARWAVDGEAPDHRHLQAHPASHLPFSFGVAHLEQLCALNRFPLAAAGDRLLFGLRGCTLEGEALGSGWTTAARLVETTPDHDGARCLLGVWDWPGGRIRLFKGSTVPSAGSMRKFVHNQPGDRCNLLPTGFYPYRVGTHARSKPREVKGAFRQQGAVVVLRTLDDLVYTVADTWDSGVVHDNLHPARRVGSDGFSSQGCQTVPGEYDRQTGVHAGAWRDFREAAGLTPAAAPPGEDGRAFHYVLLTGREARLVGQLANPGAALTRLRFGSSGGEVTRLQEGLRRAGHYTGAATALMDVETTLAFVRWQRAVDGGRADAIVTPEALRQLAPAPAPAALAPPAVAPPVPLAPDATFILRASVGRGGVNAPDDVAALKDRLIALGYHWVKPGRTVDADIFHAIDLVQSIAAGRHRVRGDGRVDVPGATLDWLQARNAPRWQVMPAGSPAEGFHNFELTDTRDKHDYGTSWLADVIRAAGAHYRDNHLRAHPAATPLTTNNVSLPRGGDTPKHSGHETGLACDLRLPRLDGQAGGITPTSPTYDRNAARAMLQALRAQPPVAKIYFNDETLIAESLCKPQDDHDDHIHFEIRPPTRLPTPTAHPPVPIPVPVPAPLSPAPLSTTAPTAPTTAFRPFFITAYHVAIEPPTTTDPLVPLLSKTGDVIAQVPAGFFAEMALQGSGRLKDGRLLSGAGWRAPGDHDYAPVLAVHRRRYPAGNKYQDRTKVSGISLEDDDITSVRAYAVTPTAKEGLGYGILRGIPLDPYRTLAADIGAFESSDDRYRGAVGKSRSRVVINGKTGLVPTGTRVYIRQLDGFTLPDGKRHDGWLQVNDTGGAIYGAHFDVFVGARDNGPPLLKLAREGTFMDIWFEGIEDRVPADYSYGFPRKRGRRSNA